MNSKERDKGINNKKQDNRKDSKSEAQSFIYASNASFMDNSIDRKSL